MKLRNKCIFWAQSATLVVVAFVTALPAFADSAPNIQIAEKPNLRFNLRVESQAPQHFFPDLWPNQNLPAKPEVDEELVTQLSLLKAKVKMPSGMAVFVPGGGTTRP